MVKKPKYKIPDQHLFRQEMHDVVPLKSTITTHSKAPRTTGNIIKAARQPVDAMNDFMPTTGTQAHIDAEDGSSHRKNGVQKRIMRKLQRGQFRVEEKLDLHSMNLETARAVLLEFIADAQRHEPECVRIIHGKGLRSISGPRLKVMTRQLLRDHPQVLAYITCKPADGGSGAVDVLLKSR